MSEETTLPASDPKAPVAPSDRLVSTQSVIAFIGMAIAAATIFMVLWTGNESQKSQTIGGVIALMGTIAGFYFQSSLGSQKKDERAAGGQK